MIICRRGLFVGVDRSSDRSNLPDLTACAADAIRLATYFRSACPTGSWEILVEAATISPRRREVIRGVHEWASSVDEHEAGLLYFAGHGVIASGGLILVPSDFDSTIPLDSGIPLRRILEVLKASGGGRRFVLWVDACRTGLEMSIADDVPSSVLVVYACLPGSVATEDGAGSTFLKAFLGAVDSGARVRIDGAVGIALSDLLTGIEAEYALLVGTQKQTLEITGSGSGDVFVPLEEQSEAGLGASRPVASAFIESRELGPATYATVVATLKRAFKAWNGYDIPHGVGTAGAIGAFVEVEGEGLVCFPLPAVSIAGPPHAFLSYVLSVCHSVFFTLHIEWPQMLAMRQLRLLCSRWSVEFRQLAEDEVLLSWVANGRSGQGLATSDSDGKTSITVSCRSKEGMPLPLDFLLPSLNDVYDALIRLGR